MMLCINSKINPVQVEMSLQFNRLAVELGNSNSTLTLTVSDSKNSHFHVSGSGLLALIYK